MPRKQNTEENVVENTQTAETGSTEATTQEGQGPQLTLADVKNAVNVIDHAANQGAFKGWDVIAQVMQVRQRLAAFVEAASPAVEGEPATEATNSGDEAANS